MTLNEMAAAAFKNSTEHGFHDGEDKIPLHYVVGTKIALIHSEMSEALEDSRLDSEDPPPYFWVDEKGKPQGLATELADAIIRIGDLCGQLGIENLDEVVKAKMEYNAGRPFKHGRKF